MHSKAQCCPQLKCDQLVVGIDVAKRRHVAVLRHPSGHMGKPFGFGNDRGGFEELVGRVAAAGADGDVVFGLEATGHYGQALQQYLLAAGLTVVGINPAHTKRVKELIDGSPEKSDPKDAMVIADLTAQGRGRPVTVPEGVYAELRRLGKLRSQLSAERTRYLNRYTGLVDLVFPELMHLVPCITRPTILSLMAEFPTAVDIASRQYRRIRRLLWRRSIGHFSEERCRQIYEAAQGSVGLREGLDAVRLQMRLVLSSLRSLEDQLAEVENAQVSAVAQVPYAARLLTIPELGAVTLATILGETGDLRRFRNASSLIKLAGLNLYTQSSGSFRGRTRITKRGRPLLRKIVYLAALRMGRQGRPLADFRGRLLDRMAKPQITVAGSRKLLRLLYALARDETEYETGRLAVAGPGQIVA